MDRKLAASGILFQSALHVGKWRVHTTRDDAWQDDAPRLPLRNTIKATSLIMMKPRHCLSGLHLFRFMFRQLLNIHCWTVRENAGESGFPKSVEIAELTCIDFLGIGLEFGKGLVLWGEMLAKHTIFGDEFNPLDVVGLGHRMIY